MKYRESWVGKNISHEEKRDELVSEVKTKVDFMKELFHNTEKSAKTYNAVEFSKWCLEKKDQVEGYLPEDAKWLIEVKKLESERMDLDFQLVDIEAQIESCTESLPTTVLEDVKKELGSLEMIVYYEPQEEYKEVFAKIIDLNEKRDLIENAIDHLAEKKKKSVKSTKI